MKVMVTGGLGFIGRVVVAKLDAQGHEPIIVDRHSGMDLLTVSPGKLPTADAVIHLAGLLGTSELFSSVDAAIDVNIKGTVRVLDWCAVEQRPFVGITMPQVWDNVYQATKNCAGRLAKSYGLTYRFPVAQVCAFNVYGPDQKVHGVQKILPTFASRSWRGKPMPIWGPGTQLVDMVHVEDVAELLVNTIGSDGGDVEGGYGTPLTVLDVARLVGDITGCSLTEFLPLRDGETTTEGVVAKHPALTGDIRTDPRFVEAVEWYKEDRP